MEKPNAKRVIADLRELAKLTSTKDGAQRVAWGPVWQKAREWYKKKVGELGIKVWTDEAGNNWATIQGKSSRSLIIGSHIDSVPNGGWLDGCLGVIAGLEVLRRYSKEKPPVTIRVVDWADEEGARFGRSLLGSSAASGSLKMDELKRISELKDRQGTRQQDALAACGVTSKKMLAASKSFKKLNGAAYLELHIEQGPVLEQWKKPTGVVLGTVGVERHMIKFTGQAAHSGSTPIPLRRDVFLAAAEFALACREIGLKMSGPTPKERVVCTCGIVKVEPCIVTACPGVCEISLDQRALNAKTLKKMYLAAKQASVAAAKRNNVKVEWQTLWQIEPRLFDPNLLKFCAEAVKEVTGEAPLLPSGPLHDAAEMQPLMPTVMMFAQSSPGLSHCKEENTPEKQLDMSIRAFLILADKTVADLAK